MKTCKIGIITLPLHQNYGGVLQAYALCQVLKDNGFEPNVLVCDNRTLKQRIKNLFDKKNKISRFVYKNIPMLHVEYSDLYNSCVKSNIDTIIVGSDQIWRPDFFDVRISFCLWVKKESMKCISYAASFGFEKWHYSQAETEIAKNGIKHFKNISVREKSAVDLCKKYLGVSPEHVLDPTMLVDATEYKKMCTPIHEKYIFSYLLAYSDKDNIECLKAFQNHYRLPLKKIFLTRNKILKRLCALPGIEEWLSLINGAKLMVTDSFHGVVFSIILKTPFYVLLNGGGGNSRIYSLLESLGLENRLITSVKEINYNSIDWDNVYQRLNKMKKTSFDFLTQALYD